MKDIHVLTKVDVYKFLLNFIFVFILFCIDRFSKIYVIELVEKTEVSEIESDVKSDLAAESEIFDSEIRLAFAFQSAGWTGTLMDRLNTFSYKDLYKKRIAKVKAKTADIKSRLEFVEKSGKVNQKYE